MSLANVSRNAGLKDSSLIVRKLASDNRIVCASPEYLAMHGEPTSPEQLINHQCIHFMNLESWVFETKNGPVSIKTKGRLRTDNGEALRDGCANGLGITINSKWSAYQLLQQGKLVQILEHYPLVSNTAIWAVYPSSSLLAPKVRAFIDHFSQFFGHTPYWE